MRGRTAWVSLTACGLRLMSARPSGDILLTPVASTPKREMIVWENEALRASLQLGIAEAESGLAAPAPDALSELDAL
jgi:hypothetical protein